MQNRSETSLQEEIQMSTQVAPRITHQMPDLADFITTEEAAKKLGFHIESIRRMLRNKELDGLKMGHGWLVSRKSVDKYLKETDGMNKRDPRRGNQ